MLLSAHVEDLWICDGHSLPGIGFVLGHPLSMIGFVMGIHSLRFVMGTAQEVGRVLALSYLELRRN